MSSKLMKCGHTAQAKTNGVDCCVICFPSPDSMVPVDKEPDLSGRQAKCSCCDKSVRESSTDLAFFEYRGPGTDYDTKHPKCRQNAKENGYEFDNYYCGCYGWD